MAKQAVRRIRPSTYSVLEDLGVVIRAAYIRNYRSLEFMLKGTSSWSPGVWWDGGRTKQGQVRKSIWNSAAKFISKYDLPVMEYVRFVVLERGRGIRVAPNHLCSKQAADEFSTVARQLREEAVSQIQLALQHQRRVAEMALIDYAEYAEMGYGPEDPEQRRRLVLLDESQELTAMFRYCLAKAENFEDVAEKYYYDALLQFLADSDAYEEVWKAWIPEEFKRACQRAKKLVKQGRDCCGS